MDLRPDASASGNASLQEAVATLQALSQLQQAQQAITSVTRKDLKQAAEGMKLEGAKGVMQGALGDMPLLQAL